MAAKTIPRFEQYQDWYARVFARKIGETARAHGIAEDQGTRMLSKTVTWQVTDSCNLACTYCYQGNKGKRVMPLEVGKAFADWLLSRTPENCDYINPVTSPSIILEFIGGEPFLQVELIGQILDYWESRCIQLDHPWLENFMVSICSNGVKYFDPEVQAFLRRWKGRLSFSISIDGNQALHDACRVFPDGSPSYELAVAGAMDWMRRGGHMGSKITLAPGNIRHAYQAIRHMYDLGYREINANCVYEKGWELEHAQILYRQMKLLADFLAEEAEPTYCSLFEKKFFRPMDEEDNTNWCGGTGFMLSCDPDGFIYPCIRYMESSLGCDVKPLRLGNVWEGLETTQEERDLVKDLQAVTRRSQSTDECFYCPIAAGCSWCSAYNYQDTGSYNKRATYICVMHKARALANVYYWGKRYRLGLEDAPMELHCPKEWAVPIIGEEEYAMLASLAKEGSP